MVGLQSIDGFLPPSLHDNWEAEKCARFCENTHDDFKYDTRWERDYQEQYNDPKEMAYKLRIIAQSVILCVKGDSPSSEEEGKPTKEAIETMVGTFKEQIDALMRMEGTSDEERSRALCAFQDGLSQTWKL